MNNLTSCFLCGARSCRLAFPTDRDCLDAGLATCWQPDRPKVRMALIPNTLELADLWVSQPLLEEARATDIWK